MPAVKTFFKTIFLGALFRLRSNELWVGAPAFSRGSSAFSAAGKTSLILARFSAGSRGQALKRENTNQGGCS